MADFTDSFDRPNNNDLGAPWVESETAAFVLNILSNTLAHNGGEGRRGLGLYDAAPAIGADQYSELILRDTSLGQVGRTGISGVVVRGSGTEASATCYLAGLRFSGGQLQIVLKKYVSQPLNEADGTELGFLSAGLALNDVLRLEVVGSEVLVRKNGAIVIGPITDTAIASGKVGVALAGSGALGESATWLSWGGGDQVASPFTDNFNRPASNSLGSPWVESENAADAIGITDPAVLVLRAENAGGARLGLAVYDGSPALGADQFSELKLVNPLNSATALAGVLVRGSGTFDSVTCYFAGMRISDRTIVLKKYVGQLFSQTGGTTLGTGPALSDGQILRLEVLGTQLTVRVNGAVVLGPITDTAIASGKAGVGIANNETLIGFAFFDDWSGGDIAVLRRSALVPVEAAGRLRGSLLALPVEIRGRLASAALLIPVEWVVGTPIGRTAGPVPVEWRQGVPGKSALMPAEWSGMLLLRRAGEIPVEVRATPRLAPGVPVEFTARLRQDRELEVESLAGVRLRPDVPVEFQGAVRLLRAAVLEIESLQRRALDPSVPVEFQGVLTRLTALPLPIEWTAHVLRPLRLEFEAAGIQPFDFADVWSVTLRLDTPFVESWLVLLPVTAGSTLEDRWTAIEDLASLPDVWRVLPGAVITLHGSDIQRPVVTVDKV